MKSRKRPAKAKTRINPEDCPTEEQEQMLFCTWLNKRMMIHYAVPNGAKRTMPQAVKLKRTGLQAGVPDLVIPLARKPYHGLYIEMKRKAGGVLSDAQRRWAEALTVQGYLVKTCKGADAAIKAVEDYLRLPYWEAV